MTTKEIIKTRSVPRRTLARHEPLSFPDTVRVYRCSTEAVMLQIHRTNDYMSIALTFDEAREIAAMLIAAAEESSAATQGYGREPMTA